MTRDNVAASTSTVTWLNQSQDFQPRSNRHEPAPGFSANCGKDLECLFGNPRFSQPANEGYCSNGASERLAPTSKACREARLIRIWIETLAEVEDDRAKNRGDDD